MRTWRGHGGAGCENRACLTRPGWCSLMILPTPRWCGCMAVAFAAGNWWAGAPHDLAITFAAAMHHLGMRAPQTIDGSMTGKKFLAYVERCLAPTLRRKDIVMIDNLPAYKATGVREAIEARSAILRYLPQYSPDLNPIEMSFSKLKADLRKDAEREFRACATASTVSLVPSRPAKLPIISGTRAMREIYRNLP